MKSVELLLVHAVLTDVGIVLHTSIDKDWAYVQSRFEDEGLSFLTITLPAFAKDFERSLELGTVSPELFAGFRKLRSNSLIPAFLSGITAHVFDGVGNVRENASTEAIEGVRQICLALNKPKMECSDARKAKAIRAFVSCEKDLRSFRPHGWSLLDDFVRISRVLYGPVLDAVQRKLVAHQLVPKHGPGAVFERIRGNGKYRSRTWSRRLERHFPFDQYGVPNWGDPTLYEGEWQGALRHVETGDRLVRENVRVVFVPKTLKSPRVIAVEPIYHQYVQQSIMAAIVPAIETDRFLAGRINFTSSDNNRNFARSASIDRSYATLDMSEASDRIHAGLVYHMLGSHPELARAIFSCRTQYAVLPDGMRIPLVKFASMGSALCFPMESMVHFVLCVLGVLKAQARPTTTRHIHAVMRQVTVFGDDLIVPVHEVAAITEVLHSAHCKVNVKKSFSTGYFRESCGVDAYKGVIVTPTYVRTVAPRSFRDVKEIVSYVASANLFYKKGYWKTAQFMRDIVEAITGPLPHVEDTSPLLGWTSFTKTKTISRWNKSLCRFETSGLRLRTRKRKDVLDGYDRLLKFFLNRGSSPDGAMTKSDFEESVILDSAALRRGWSTAY